ncbi:hypothetical protein CWB73_05020 [Pseudoalteromonas phenolica]|uniref:Uncharacterized protein n=1 Tax=Pseudoalteromonas phenolica TaxID=161398 RepID=A0A5S3YXZ2_9GAMM|nr:hypothetical protein [Pseudoalteromonas phenolica]TMP82254.1 hypothetical protein CWB73_05020 [Pseudoalteromonas phenolica]
MNIKVIFPVIALLCVSVYLFTSNESDTHSKQEFKIKTNSEIKEGVISNIETEELTSSIVKEHLSLSEGKEIQLKPQATSPSMSNSENKLADEEAFLLALADKIESKGLIGDKILNNIQSKFDAEEIDADWAYTFEENIYSAVKQQENTDVTISQVECKTSLCKVQVDAITQDKTLLGMKFTKIMSEQSWSQESGYYFNYLSSGKNLEVIITRDEKTLNEFFN